MRCPVCDAPQESDPCVRCGSVRLTGGIGLPLPPLPDRRPPPAREEVDSLLLLPGIEKAVAERLAGSGETLGTLFARGLSPRAVRLGVHHSMVLDLSMRTLKPPAANIPTLTYCGRCGGPVPEEAPACESCGAMVFFGEPVWGIERALASQTADDRPLDEIDAFNELPEDLKVLLRAALHETPSEPEA